MCGPLLKAKETKVKRQHAQTFPKGGPAPMAIWGQRTAAPMNQKSARTSCNNPFLPIFNKKQEKESPQSA